MPEFLGPFQARGCGRPSLHAAFHGARDDTRDGVEAKAEAKAEVGVAIEVEAKVKVGRTCGRRMMVIVCYLHSRALAALRMCCSSFLEAKVYSSSFKRMI